MTTRSMLFFSALAVLFSSCTKEEPFKKSKNYLLTVEAWFVEKDEVEGANGLWHDEFGSWETCKQDDKWIFNYDFDVDIDEATIPCGMNAANHVFKGGTWSISGNGTILLTDAIADKMEEFVIEQLDEEKLVLLFIDKNGGTPSQERFTFIH